MDRVNELEVTMHRDFATKKEVSRIDSEVQVLAKSQVALEKTLQSIDARLEGMSGHVQWGVRCVVGILLTSMVGSAAYFLVRQTGLL